MPILPAAALEEHDIFPLDEHTVFEPFAAEKHIDSSGSPHEVLSSRTEVDEILFLFTRLKGDENLNGDLFFPKTAELVDLGLTLSKASC